MFKLVKQVFIVLFSFSRSLAGIANIFDRKKCMSLNNQPCMSIPTFTDLNFNECNDCFTI